MTQSRVLGPCLKLEGTNGGLSRNCLRLECAASGVTSSPSLQEFKHSRSNLLCKRGSSRRDLSHPSQDRESRDCSLNHLTGLDTVLGPHELAPFQREEKPRGCNVSSLDAILIGCSALSAISPCRWEKVDLGGSSAWLISLVPPTTLPCRCPSPAQGCRQCSEGMG